MDQTGSIVIEIFVDYVINLLDRIPIRDPILYFHNNSYTYIQAIQNHSYISFHSNEIRNTIHVDLNTISIINPDIITCYAKHFFNSKKNSYRFIEY